MPFQCSDLFVLGHANQRSRLERRRLVPPDDGQSLSVAGGFDATAWGINPSLNNGHPYLLWQLPNGTQVVDGYVYTDGGITLAGNGIVVSALVNGVSLSSLGGTVTTGANGSYNFLLPPGTILASGSQVLTYTTGANAGAAYRQNATGSVTNLNIYEGYLNETGGATTLGGLSAGLTTALGGN